MPVRRTVGRVRHLLVRHALVQGASLLALWALLGVLAPPGPAWAQAKYPDRTVRLIVPFAAGGATDIIARTLAAGLQEAFGQTVVVENRPGAGSNLGANVVAKADADGYTLLLASSGIIASPALYKSLPYDIFKDLAPVAELVGGPNIIVANVNAGINSIADVVAQAKANPDKLNYGSPGTGTTPQLAMELFKLRAGVNVTHVAYGGAAPAMQSIMAGTVQLGSMALSNIHPQVKAGAYKGIAVTGKERWHDLPDVQTVEQAGYPDFDSETVFILMAPGATPKEIIDRVAKESITHLNKPEVRDRMQAAGMAILARGPDALRARIVKEVPMYKDIVSKAKIPVN